MSKSHLATVIQHATEVSANKANEAAGHLLNHITKVLKEEGSFALPGIGNLVVKDTAARTARNPKTGEAIQVPAGRTVRFKLSSVLKKAV